MTTEILSDCPTAMLSCGAVVANFSSAVEYVFSDGTVLPGCSMERALRLAPEEGHHQYVPLPLEIGYRDEEDNWQRVSGVKLQTVKEDWIMSERQSEELDRLEADEEINIVIVSAEMMRLLREVGRDIGKCRTPVPVGYSGRLFSASYFGG